jgi:hypothetical protein
MPDIVQALIVNILGDGVILYPGGHAGDVFFGQVQPAHGAFHLGRVLLHHAHAADGQELLVSRIELPPDEHLLLRFHLELHRQRLAQLGRFLSRPLLKNLLLFGGDLLDPLEHLVAILADQDFLAAQLRRRQLGERLFFFAEEFFDQGHWRKSE